MKGLGRYFRGDLKLNLLKKTSIYYTFQDIRANSKLLLKGLFIYLKDTHIEKEPLPWKASTLNYKIVGMKKAMKPNRFIKK